MAPPPYAPGAPEQPAAAQEEPENEALLITSPIVGTFYSAPAPDAPAFVKVGDHVKNGQTVCILEAMKLMNEIQSEFDCEIEAVLVSNEQKVEYGQPLFRVKKL
jgi:acetyl-CoA carboxylase biotin carboxyl carrier protein